MGSCGDGWVGGDVLAEERGGSGLGLLMEEMRMGKFREGWALSTALRSFLMVYR